MQLTAIYFLLITTAIFTATAAIRKDRQLLLAAGTTLLLTSAFTLTTGIEYKEGENYSYTTIDNETVKTSTTNNYEKLSQDTNYNNANNWFSLILIGTGIYMIIRGATPVKRKMHLLTNKV